MALMISEECIACDACVVDCPNDAIHQSDPIYIIDPHLCTECVGAHDEPQCSSICPVECIVTDPDHQEAHEELLEKYHRLHPEQIPDSPS